jgi:hypothetical protein
MRLVVAPSLGSGEIFALVDVNDWTTDDRSTNDRTSDSERPGEQLAHRTTRLDDCRIPGRSDVTLRILSIR